MATKLKIGVRLMSLMSWVEAIADKIYLSSDETDEETRKAYLDGKAKLADALKDSE